MKKLNTAYQELCESVFKFFTLLVNGLHSLLVLQDKILSNRHIKYVFALHISVLAWKLRYLIFDVFVALFLPPPPLIL